MFRINFENKNQPKNNHFFFEFMKNPQNVLLNPKNEYLKKLNLDKLTSGICLIKKN